MQITDAHIHLWANDQAPVHHWRSPFSMDDALREMDAAGIAGAVNQPPNWDTASNEYAAQAAEAYPDRFATLGWFPLDEKAAEESADRLLAMPGMLGMRFILALPENSELLTGGKLEWLWSVANERELPMSLFILPQQINAVGDIAKRYPKMRLLIDHLSVLPFVKLPDAKDSVDQLLCLSSHANIAVKATAVPGMATDNYPFTSTHEILKITFDAFGAERMFWGTDFTRMRASMSECVNLFVKELDWLKGSELEAVMGASLRNWIRWV